MFASRPVVHPVEAPPLREGGNNEPRVRMKDIQGMAGTPGGLSLRLFQFLSAVVSLCVMMGFTQKQKLIGDYENGFIRVDDMILQADTKGAHYLVVAVSLQSLWSLSLAIMDIYALLVRRSLRNSRIIGFFTVGDGITSTLTFSAACASAGITVLIENDLERCAMNPCTRFESAIAMAFISWFAVSPSFFLNFWSLASQ